MARPIDEQRRLEIARGALHVLRARGLANTTMTAIARELGMKRPTLYFYFPDVSAIFATLVEQVMRDETEFVGMALAGSGIDHPLDLLHAWMEADLAFYSQPEHQDFLLLVAQFWATGSHEAQERFRGLMRSQLAPLRLLLVGALSRGITDGTVAPCDPEGVVDSCMALLNGCLVMSGLGTIDATSVLHFTRAQVLEPLRRTP